MSLSDGEIRVSEGDPSPAPLVIVATLFVAVVIWIVVSIATAATPHQKAPVGHADTSSALLVRATTPVVSSTQRGIQAVARPQAAGGRESRGNMFIVSLAVGTCVLATLVALYPRRRKEEESRRAEPELARCWRFLETDEEVRAATLRALSYDQEQARDLGYRLARRQWALEQLQAGSEPGTDTVHLVAAPAEDESGPEAA
jgi:hypothetical protein